MLDSIKYVIQHKIIYKNSKIFVYCFAGVRISLSFFIPSVAVAFMTVTPGIPIAEGAGLGSI